MIAGTNKKKIERIIISRCSDKFVELFAASLELNGSELCQNGSAVQQYRGKFHTTDWVDFIFIFFTKVIQARKRRHGGPIQWISVTYKQRNNVKQEIRRMCGSNQSITQCPDG